MYASKHPFRDTLVIEIDREDVLALHGAILDPGLEVGPEEDALISMLEAFHAGTDLTRFERSNDD